MSNVIHSVETDAIAREGALRLQVAIDGLPVRDKVVVMGAALGKPYDEIGVELGCSKQAAEQRHKRALEGLRRTLAAVGYRSVADFGIAA